MKINIRINIYIAKLWVFYLPAGNAETVPTSKATLSIEELSITGMISILLSQINMEVKLGYSLRVLKGNVFSSNAEMWI